MKLLSYCLFCLFVARVQSEPEITKLFPVDGLVTYHRQVNNATKPLMDKFLEKLRDTYNFVFRPSGNNTKNVENFLARSATDSAMQTLKLLRANQLKLDNYTNLKYPNDSLLKHVKSLWSWEDQEGKGNSSGLQKDFTVEVESTIKEDGSNASRVNSDGGISSGETKTLNDDWLNDVQPLGQLELQDEEDSDEMKTEKPDTSIKFPSTLGRNLIEWLGTFFRLTYKIYTRLSGEACNSEQATN